MSAAHTPFSPPKLRRRSLLLAAAATAAGCGSVMAQANTMRFVVGSAPGGSLDVPLRLLAPKLSEALGKTIVIENKPGASGTIAVRQIEASTPEAPVFSLYPTTSLMGFVLQGQEPQLDKLSVISQVYEQFTVFAINPTLPGMDKVHTIQDLIALAKQAPQPLSYASPSPGSISHLTAERLANLAGMQLQHVAYKSAAPALTDLLAGHLPMVALDMTTISPHLGSPKLRPLAINFPKRVPHLPNVPTLGEAGFQDLASVVAWVTLVGPAKLPAEQVVQINAAVAKAIADPAVNKRMNELYAIPKTGTPQAARALMQRDLGYWRKVLSDNKITL